MKRRIEYYLVYIFLVILIQCKTGIDDKFITSAEKSIENLTIFQRIEQEENYSIFLEMTLKAGYDNAFNALNPYGNNYTLFLPNNQALENYVYSMDRYSSVDDLMADTEFIRELIRFHVVNSQYNTFDFTLGALGDTTLNGEKLLIEFNTDPNTEQAAYYVNNEVKIIIPNILCSNGIIHEIDAVMTPIVSTCYEILKELEGFSIFTEGLEKTGLNELMTVYKTLPNGKVVRNYFTLLIEPDTVYNNNGIFSLEDLADTLKTDYDYADAQNGVNNFFRYHMLEEAYFLSDFETGLYPTFGVSPVSFSVSDEIRINVGSKVYDSIYQDKKAVAKDWIDIYFELSNIAAKNGAIHVISDPMTVFFPYPQTITFNFTEEPGFSAVRYTEGYHSFTDPEDLVNWNWSGANALQYIYLEESPYTGNNAMQIQGFFKLEYTTPKILPGQYDVYAQNDGYSSRNATVQFYIDGNKIGPPVDFTVGGKSASSPMTYVCLGYVSFDEYRSHKIKLEAISGGTLIWDYIQFVPVSK